MIGQLQIQIQGIYKLICIHQSRFGNCSQAGELKNVEHNSINISAFSKIRHM